MSTVRRTLDLDPQTNTRLDSLAAERGQDVAAVVADAVELLDTVLDIKGPDIEEDRRRVREFERTREAIPFEEVMAWVQSWETTNEMAPPNPRKIS
jgi:predicted transcriptional regulator